MLTADAIRAVDDTQFEVVPVPEWGGDVRLRGLTAEEKDKWDKEIVSVDNKGNVKAGRQENLRALLVVRCLVDADGERLYRDPDAKMLGQKSSKVVTKLFDIAAKLSGMREEEIEEEAANLDEAQPDDNSSE